jgi:hypothetical protein
MNSHQQAAIDRHAWWIFQSYLPEVEGFRGRRRLAEGQRVTEPQRPGGIGRPETAQRSRPEWPQST